MKGKNSAVWERCKFDFGHYCAILTIFLKNITFCLTASFWARREDHFQRKFSKTDLPFGFCKIGLRNTLFIFGRKRQLNVSQQNKQNKQHYFLPKINKVFWRRIWPNLNGRSVFDKFFLKMILLMRRKR